MFMIYMLQHSSITEGRCRIFYFQCYKTCFKCIYLDKFKKHSIKICIIHAIFGLKLERHREAFGLNYSSSSSSHVRLLLSEVFFNQNALSISFFCLRDLLKRKKPEVCVWEGEGGCGRKSNPPLVKNTQELTLQ